MSENKISVIIPNYNGSKTIERCIGSIYAQKVRIWELIVVDNSSTDNSVRLVRDRFPEAKVIKLDKNYGAAKARNVGIRNSTGNLLLFLDSDVYLSDGCIKEMLKHIDEFDIVYPTVLFEDGTTILSPASESERKYIRRSTVFMIKRESLNNLDELFDENYFIYYEDVDFFMRCYLAGLKSKYVGIAKAYHAITETSNRNLERRYYLETRNRIYCMVKFMNAPKSARKLLLIPDLHSILGMVHIAFLNKNIYSSYPDHAGKNKLSNSRIKLIYILLKAILWNALNLRECLKKQKIISRKYGGGG